MIRCAAAGVNKALGCSPPRAVCPIAAPEGTRIGCDQPATQAIAYNRIVLVLYLF